MTQTYEPWFERLTQHVPRPWQARLAADSECRSRIVRAPTGTGKTLGVFGAWAYHRLERREPSWPRRLVLVLPMRVLAEQCEQEIRAALANLGRLAEPGRASDLTRVAVHVLMGGVESVPWHLYPEHDAVLIGTQDMLLSRALNRGYGSAPGRWPMEYALLHHDALWVLDEVQLMDVGFATSAQLQAFRDVLSPKAFRPAHSWWMSATLQTSWFKQTAWGERRGELEEAAIRVPEQERHGGPFDAKKSLRVVDISRAEDTKNAAWARQVLAAHAESQVGSYGRITLAICNTVEDATALYQLVTKEQGKTKVCDAVELVHSRFRGMERAAWRDRFLSRDRCNADANRIVIATQVVEAGVDISCTALVTQLAPWASLVQRMGRAARYGEGASITVVDRALSDEKNALPYELDELNAAREALMLLKGDASLSAIEELEAGLESGDRELLARLYPYEPIHILSERDHEELFDTEPDLTGQDLDVSRFIRSGDERDVQLWWYPLERDERDARFVTPDKDMRPRREELCRVPVGKAREFLLEKAAEAGAAFVWDFGEGRYKALRKQDRAVIFPGQIFLVDSRFGGYDEKVGFTGAVGARNDAPISALPRSLGLPEDSGIATQDEQTNLAEADDSLSHSKARTIATHCAEAGARAANLCEAIALPEKEATLVELAARLHDIGKAHPAFQASILEKPEGRNDLAKADKWKSPPYTDKQNPAFDRPGLRHEFVSTLMLFELLHQLDPYHPALLGPHRELLELLGEALPDATLDTGHNALEQEVLGLDGSGFDLTAYLVCAHHGKVRVGLRASVKDQEVGSRLSAHRNSGRAFNPLRGAREDDTIPSIQLLRDGAQMALRELTLHLDVAQLGISTRYGASWSERVSALRSRYGVHALAYLETILRVADVRASAECSEDDPLLREGGLS